MGKLLKSDIKRAMLSWKFWGGMALSVLVGILQGLPYARQLLELGSMSAEPAYVSLTKYCLYTDLFGLVIPIVSPMAFGIIFEEEMSSRFIIFSLPRSGKKSYIFSKIMVSGISGGAVVFGGVILILLINRGVILNGNGNSQESAANYILTMTGLCFLAGALWSMIGGIAASVTKNKYMSYMVPFILYYIFTVFQERYYKTWNFLNPKQWSAPVKISELQAFLALCILLMITGTVYFYTIKRRMDSV